VTESRGFDGLRAFDLALTLLLLPFVLLIGALVAIAIFIDSPGPIFYRCARLGRGGRVFSMLKFRKMRDGSSGPLLTGSDDERFTPIGRFLALTKLDELPQVWNVLKGEMRLVGPRPEVEEFVHTYPEQYEQILSVMPGITGVAQLEYAAESRLFADAHDTAWLYNEQILPRKIELDLRYIRTQSLLGDLKILARTPVLPVRRLRLALKAARGGLVPARLAVYALLAACTLALVASFAAAAGPR
jgi:lipopolysaccharide/colanic/teichoic acid biosynthesis glycosyltransferase